MNKTRFTPPPIDIWYSSLKRALVPSQKKYQTRISSQEYHESIFFIIPLQFPSVWHFLFRAFVQGGLRTCCGTCCQVYSRNFVMENLLIGGVRKTCSFQQMLYPKHFNNFYIYWYYLVFLSKMNSWENPTNSLRNKSKQEVFDDILL